MILSAAAVDVRTCGPAAVRVVADSGHPEHDWAFVHALGRWLGEHGRDAGVVGLIPTYDSLLIEFDPILASSREVCTLAALGVERTLQGGLPAPAPRHFDVPVLYGHADGPDLGWVADLMGWSAERLIEAHTAKTYVIRCFGSPAASPMMDAPALPKPVPRLGSPRPAVPAGVVSLAGRQAVIAPASAPGGWRVIGRTPLVLLRPEHTPVVPYRPGDTLRFHRIGVEEYEALRGSWLGVAP